MTFVFMHFTQQALCQHIARDALLIHFNSYSVDSVHNTISSFFVYLFV